MAQSQLTISSKLVLFSVVVVLVGFTLVVIGLTNKKAYVFDENLSKWENALELDLIPSLPDMSAYLILSEGDDNAPPK